MQLSASPIVLFAYNRPWHLAQTLQALSNNRLASDSELYIYCDGAKPGATAEQLAAVEGTREVARRASGFKSVEIKERDENFGLARSIISGVTEIVERFGRVIVLEDDIVTSPGFLQYMNDALTLYADEEKVMHISGYWFPVKGSEKLPETFFYMPPSCWGWATWDRAWKALNTDAKDLKTQIEQVDPGFYKFNIENSYPFSEHLMLNIEGHIDTWAVKWYGSIFLKKGCSLHPNRSLVNNIGLDGSGENCGQVSMYFCDKLNNSVLVLKKNIVNLDDARILVKFFYRKRIYSSKIKRIRHLFKKIHLGISKKDTMSFKFWRS